MNIFYLHEDIDECAKAYFDCHVIKMILESAQILSTVCAKHGIKPIYRSTHQNHPCTLWAGESIDNWIWLRSLAFALNQEYKYRFNHSKSHKSATEIKKLKYPMLEKKGITERPQVMPEIDGKPISAYRSYYASEKIHLLKYTRRTIPNWISNRNT